MSFLKKSLQLCFGLSAFLLLTLSTVVTFIPFFMISCLKLVPYEPWRLFCTNLLRHLTTNWIRFNNLCIQLTRLCRIKIHGVEQIEPSHWYLIIANHQSWLDIVILQYALVQSNRVPFLKFFTKSALKWVPLLGFAWWALGYPFMKRYSKSYLAKNPHKKGHDIQTTLKAIQRFRKLPASFVSFIEGTRFSPAKKAFQQSHYKHLLKPKAGGISFVIGAMHEEIDSLLDVTITYQDPKQQGIWRFLCRQIEQIDVHFRRIPIPSMYRSPNLLSDEALQASFRDWINQQWQEKDELISSLRPA